MAKREIAAGTHARQAEVSGIVIRCGCSDPDSHAREGRPCPSPRATEDLGALAYWHRNPIRRFWGRLMLRLGASSAWRA